MNVRLATPEEIEIWDEKLASNPDGGNVFQAYELAETKRRGGWTPIYIVVNDSIAITALEKHVLPLGCYWYLPKGPGVTNITELLDLLPSLKEFGKSRGVFAIKTETEILESDDARQSLANVGLVRTRNIQPNGSTVIIDLSPSLDDIIASFNQKGRHAVHRAERDGVTAKSVDLTDENMRIMFELLGETASGRFESSLRSYDYYAEYWQRYTDNGRGQLFFSYFEGKVVAGAYCMLLGEKGLYKDGASVRERTAYGASHLLQWEAMKWMKSHGAKSYDLCGSPHSSQIDNDQGHFYGIGRFKTSFNKHVTDYIGCYDIIVNPFAYKLWQKFVERLVISLHWRLKHDQWF